MIQGVSKQSSSLARPKTAHHQRLVSSWACIIFLKQKCPGDYSSEVRFIKGTFPSKKRDLLLYPPTCQNEITAVTNHLSLYQIQPLMKYYFSEKQCLSYKADNDKTGGTHNLHCRSFVKGKEFTYATNRDTLPVQFDDYVLVLESEEELQQEAGEPY